MTDWIQTNSGKEFHYTLDQSVLKSQIDINDIAHSLANITRFLGHTNRRVTVLQHSLAVAAIVPKEYRLQALLHDAAEAYVGDIPTPLKKHLGNTFAELERAIEKAIWNKFGLPDQLHPIVRLSDEAILFYEKDLMFSDSLNWGWRSHIKPKDHVVKRFYSAEWTAKHFVREVLACV